LLTLIDKVAGLMCDTCEDLITHAEVLVVAKTDEQARQAPAAVRSKQLVIGLSRGGSPR
jgi:hypothetical protein